MAYLPPKFGPFEPLERLGAGGMAETFVALRRGPAGFEQRVCIKRILPAFESDQEFVRAFLSEARTSAALRHNNIVQVLDFGIVAEEGSHYLALELIDGLDLRALLQSDANFDADLVILIASELASALEYAHGSDGGRAQVIHRDISPSNVLVSTAGEVKLTDFGIARVAGAGHRTATGVIKGKIPYMPPEYIEHGRFDERGDLFALGVLMFELLSRERPFDGESELDTLRRIVAGERRPLPPTIDAPLRACIERSIATQPAERFASARALLDALPPIAVNTTRRRLAELVRGARAAIQPHGPATPAALAHQPAGAALARPEAAALRAPTERGARPVDPTRTAHRPGRLRPSRTAVVVLLASAALLGAVIGSLVLRLNPQAAGASATPPQLPSAPSRSPSASSSPSEGPRAAEPFVKAAGPTTDATNEPAPEVPRSPGASSSPREDARAARAAKSGRSSRGSAGDLAELRVVVVPFGEVWVDDKYIGHSPISVRLAPGTHAVAVGEGRARERRTVSLEPDEREQVVFRTDDKRAP